MIHAYKIHGENIVLDVMSGAVHLLDDIAYDVLGCYDSDGTLNPDKLRELTQYDETQINEAIVDIEYLIDNKMLFTDDPYTEMLPVWTKQTVVKALCLHIAHDCNLRCSYCFADTGSIWGIVR